MKVRPNAIAVIAPVTNREPRLATVRDLPDAGAGRIKKARSPLARRPSFEL